MYIFLFDKIFLYTILLFLLHGILTDKDRTRHEAVNIICGFRTRLHSKAFSGSPAHRQVQHRPNGG